MSSGPRTRVDVSTCRAGAAPKVGYMNRSGGATPPCHVGTFSGTCSDFRRSLVISLYTWRCMTLAESLEQRGGLFLDSASMLFFRGERSGSGELPEDNSLFVDASPSPCSIGFLPLFCLTGGAGWLLPHAFSP